MSTFVFNKYDSPCFESNRNGMIEAAYDSPQPWSCTELCWIRIMLPTFFISKIFATVITNWEDCKINTYNQKLINIVWQFLPQTANPEKIIYDFSPPTILSTLSLKHTWFPSSFRFVFVFTWSSVADLFHFIIWKIDLNDVFMFFHVHFKLHPLTVGMVPLSHV